MQMHAGEISKLLCGFVSVSTIIHSLNLVDYLPEPCNVTYTCIMAYFLLTTLVSWPTSYVFSTNEQFIISQYLLCMKAEPRS